MLGIREPDIYGRADYDDLVAYIEYHAAEIGVEVEVFQSNHEGDLIDKIQQAYGVFNGIVINPGAFTHTSVGLLDAVKAVGIPTIEVHISDPDTRDDFRSISYIRSACVETIKGHGLIGYGMALDALKEKYSGKQQALTTVRCVFKPALKNNAESVSDLEDEDKVNIITAPPSKSIAHRMLICAALTDSTSRISGIELSEDVKATMNCLRKLGADIVMLPEGRDKHHDLYTVIVKGILKTNKPENKENKEDNNETKENDSILLDCNESGSTLRFMIPVCTLLYEFGFLEADVPICMTGSSRLLKRPLETYDSVFEYTYVSFSHNDRYVQVMGGLKAGGYSIPGDVSSQFITGMLFVLPMLDGDSRLNIIPPIESRPYIDMTMQVLRRFGVEMEWLGENSIHIPGNQRYQALDTRVEGDWSNGAILLTLARLCKRLDRKIVVTGLSENSCQGDKVINDMLDVIDMGESVNISDCPDLGPILMAYMAAIGGGCMHGTSRLAIKESDRGQAMKQELEKMGATVHVGKNDITVISDGGLSTPSGVIGGHNDHRIVMSMAVLCSLYGGIIDGCEAVAKSFPSFWNVMNDLGFEIDRENIYKDRQTC